jgi:hypothetical protein
LEDRQAPAVLTVNSTADTANPTDSYLSLREALAIVNSPTLPSGLSAAILGQISGTLHGGGADRIQFDSAAVAGPITLGGTELQVSLPGSTAVITIDGGPSGVTVDGNNASRVFQVDSGVQTAFDHLSVAHGQAPSSSASARGGGVSNDGTLTIRNCVFDSNTAINSSGGGGGAISSTGTLSLTDSTVRSNRSSIGGGVFSTGTLTVSRSTFRSNVGNTSFSGAGGAIYSTGTLTVADSTFTSNSSRNNGGAICGFAGTVTVSGSTFTSNSSRSGGGIDFSSQDTLTVTDSVFTSNHGLYGGGLSTIGTVTVSNCTFDANASLQLGGTAGAIFNAGTLTLSNSTLTANSSFADGGGLENSGTLTVSNCTLSGNSAGAGPASHGGGIYNSGTLTVSSSTLTANRVLGYGGGIANSGTLTLRNTIVAGNVSTGQLRGPDVNGPVTGDSGYNLIGADDGSLSGISDGTNGNQIGTAANPIDPRLARLGYHGGPTETYPLLSDSPAFEAGDPGTTLTTDQRGLPRVVAGHTDIGAFQTQANPFLVTTLLDPGRQFGQLSLREAVNLANVLPGSNTVTFAPDLASGTVTLAAGPLLLDHNLDIAGLRAGPVTVSGNNASRVFDVAAGVSVTLASLIVTNGRVSSATQAQGGGIRNAGNLTLNGCTITNNQATAGLTGTGSEVVLAQGGGIYSTGGLTLTGCIVSGNSANLSAGNVYAGNDNGGGIYNNGGTVGLDSCTVSGNSVNATFTGGAGVLYAYGGGLTSDNGTLTLTDCTVVGNTATGGNADGLGGGVHSFHSTVSLSNCTIANNTATSTGDAGFGGGVSGLDTSLSLTSCTLTGNSASSAASTGSGGGIYYNSSVGSARLLNTIVAGNSSLTDGPDVSGTFSSQGYNLIGISDGSAGWGGSDLTGTAASPLDPLLGTLGDYGGPTPTVPLLAGSPALNAGDPAQLGTADQRGAVRTGGVNIGAFQASAASFVLTAPGTAISGVAFDVGVAVYDAFGQRAVGYTGTVHFSTSDNDPGVVLPADYTFGPGDAGMVTFAGGVTLVTPGNQTLTVTDLASGITFSVVVTL